MLWLFLDTINSAWKKVNLNPKEHRERKTIPAEEIKNIQWEFFLLKKTGWDTLKKLLQFLFDVYLYNTGLYISLISISPVFE